MLGLIGSILVGVIAGLLLIGAALALFILEGEE